MNKQVEDNINSLLAGQNPLTIAIAKEALTTASEILGSTSALLTIIAAGYLINSGEGKATEKYGKEVGRAVIQHRTEAGTLLLETANKLAKNDKATLEKYKPVVLKNARRKAKKALGA